MCVTIADTDHAPRWSTQTDIIEFTGWVVRVADGEKSSILIRRKRRRCIPQRTINTACLVEDSEEEPRVRTLHAGRIVLIWLTPISHEFVTEIPLGKIRSPRQTDLAVKLVDLAPKDGADLDCCRCCR